LQNPRTSPSYLSFPGFLTHSRAAFSLALAVRDYAWFAAQSALPCPFTLFRLNNKIPLLHRKLLSLIRRVTDDYLYLLQIIFLHSTPCTPMSPAFRYTHAARCCLSYSRVTRALLPSPLSMDCPLQSTCLFSVSSITIALKYVIGRNKSSSYKGSTLI
jgi:hypothetical protein